MISNQPSLFVHFYSLQKSKILISWKEYLKTMTCTFATHKKKILEKDNIFKLSLSLAYFISDWTNTQLSRRLFNYKKGLNFKNFISFFGWNYRKVFLVGHWLSVIRNSSWQSVMYSFRVKEKHENRKKNILLHLTF